MQLRYNYRLYPAPRERQALARAFGCARVVFNDALAARQEAHAAGQPYLTDGELSARLTAAKATRERAWLGEVSAVVLQQALADLTAAYRNFFASAAGTRKGPRAGRPGSGPARPAAGDPVHPQRPLRLTAGGKLRLPKIGDSPVRWSRDLPSPSSVTVIKDAAGGTSPASCPGRRRPAAGAGVEAGIDWAGALRGPVDGRKVASPRFLRRAERGSAGPAPARRPRASTGRPVRVARVHARVADARRDWLHKESTRIIRDSQAVYVEDLCVAGLGRTRLAKSVHDAGWSAFVHMLEYKAARHGRTFARTGRFEPTSQVCSACGTKDGPKPLSVRTWTCTACGTVHDRDLNAARNILALGRRERLNACGGGVRPGLAPAAASETGILPGAA